MQAVKNIGLGKTSACGRPLRWQLAIAFVIGMFVQHALVGHCFAQDDPGQSSDSQLTAAMPEAGSPPAPASANEQASDESAHDDEPSSDESAQPPAVVEVPSAESDSSRTSVDRAEAKVRELSVSPERKSLLPEGRPAWVGAPPDLSNPRRHRLFVGSIPTSSIDEVDAALDEPLLAAVNDYVALEVLQITDADELRITADFIRRNLLDASTEYVAELSTSAGPLYQKWVVLEITPEHREHFIDAYRQVKQKKRMVSLGLGLAGVLGITGMAHLAFNRRRRRYTASTTQPAVHTILAELEPVATKPNNRGRWLFAGSLCALAMLGLVLLGGVLFTTQVRSSRAVIFPGEHAVPLPPAPPTPPPAPEIYFDQAVIDSMMQQQRDAQQEHLRQVKAASEAHQQTTQFRSQFD